MMQLVSSSFLNFLPPGKFSPLFCRLLIFFKINFLKNSVRNMIRVSISLDRADVLSGLIWFQAVCKSYLQMTLGDKELTCLTSWLTAIIKKSAVCYIFLVFYC